MGASAIADAAAGVEMRARHGSECQEALVALRDIAERSYPSLLDWCERSA